MSGGVHGTGQNERSMSDISHLLLNWNDNGVMNTIPTYNIRYWKDNEGPKITSNVDRPGDMTVMVVRDENRTIDTLAYGVYHIYVRKDYDADATVERSNTITCWIESDMTPVDGIYTWSFPGLDTGNGSVPNDIVSMITPTTLFDSRDPITYPYWANQVTGKLKLMGTDDSTSLSTGTMVIPYGGLGVGKRLTSNQITCITSPSILTDVLRLDDIHETSISVPMTGTGVPTGFSVVIVLQRIGTNVFLNIKSIAFTATGSGEFMSSLAIIPSNYRPSYSAILNSSVSILTNHIPIVIEVLGSGFLTIVFVQSTWESGQIVRLYDYHLGWARTEVWV
jgi:hypothetical protein